MSGLPIVYNKMGSLVSHGETPFVVVIRTVDENKALSAAGDEASAHCPTLAVEQEGNATTPQPAFNVAQPEMRQFDNGNRQGQRNRPFQVPRKGLNLSAQLPEKTNRFLTPIVQPHCTVVLLFL
jgi:hypothetical protein